MDIQHAESARTNEQQDQPVTMPPLKRQTVSLEDIHAEKRAEKRAEMEAESEEDRELSEPPFFHGDQSHPLWEEVRKGLRSVFDPEIPVNIFELGLIYDTQWDEENNLHVTMTLTAPGCPVAGEMPGMVSDALKDIEGIGKIDVDIVWDPPWNPGMMSETAKLELNMFF